MDKHRITLPDGHEFTLHATWPESPRAIWYWLPALGVPGRKYQRLAESLAERGVALVAHEWRGTDTSNQRASRRRDWGYRQLFDDVAAGIQFIRDQRSGLSIWIGGHSLGSQIALLHLTRDPSLAGGIVVAGGSPYWRTYPKRKWAWLSVGMFGFPVISKVVGHFPGTRVGFAGREAAGVMIDWARTARSGTYRPKGLRDDFEAKLSSETRPILSAHLQQDELVPINALEFLLRKAPKAKHQRAEFTTKDFDSGRADHFSWMKEPVPVADRLATMMANVA